MSGKFDVNAAFADLKADLEDSVASASTRVKAMPSPTLSSAEVTKPAPVALYSLASQFKPAAAQADINWTLTQKAVSGKNGSTVVASIITHANQQMFEKVGTSTDGKQMRITLKTAPGVSLERMLASIDPDLQRTIRGTEIVKKTSAKGNKYTIQGPVEKMKAVLDGTLMLVEAKEGNIPEAFKTTMSHSVQQKKRTLRAS